MDTLVLWNITILNRKYIGSFRVHVPASYVRWPECKSPEDRGTIPLPRGLLMAYKWGCDPNHLYTSTGMILQVVDEFPVALFGRWDRIDRGLCLSPLPRHSMYGLFTLMWLFFNGKCRLYIYIHHTLSVWVRNWVHIHQKMITLEMWTVVKMLDDSKAFFEREQSWKVGFHDSKPWRSLFVYKYFRVMRRYHHCLLFRVPGVNPKQWWIEQGHTSTFKGVPNGS